MAIRLGTPEMPHVLRKYSTVGDQCDHARTAPFAFRADCGFPSEWEEMMTLYRPDLAPLPLRLVLGFGFVYHGWEKIADGTEGFQEMLQMIGIPGGAATAWFVALIEFIGGLALIAGAFVPIFAALLIGDMLVAMFTVHLPHGFSFMNMIGMGPEGPEFGMPGYEINLLYIAGLLALILAGSGAYSVDAKRQGRPMTAARDEKVADRVASR
jgi:putative oxidoreductase